MPLLNISNFLIEKLSLSCLFRPDSLPLSVQSPLILGSLLCSGLFYTVQVGIAYSGMTKVCIAEKTLMEVSVIFRWNFEAGIAGCPLTSPDRDSIGREEDREGQDRATTPQAGVSRIK